MEKPVIVIGSGGHAKVLLDALLLSGREIIGMTEFDKDKWGSSVWDVPVLGGDDIILSYGVNEIELVNGIGSIGSTEKRKNVFEYFVCKGYKFAKVIHPSAIISPRAFLADGVQVLAGGIVNPGVRIGADSIVNTRASLDHDVQVGTHVHIAPGVTISGGVIIGTGTHIGTGANVIQGISIGRNNVIGAGALVTRNIADDNVKAYGVPAKEVQDEL